MSEIKVSQLTSAESVTGEELILVAQPDGNGGWSSFSAKLTDLITLYGAITDLPVGTNLNDVVEAGLYNCYGAETQQASYNLNYPSGLYPGSKALMAVSVEAPSSAGGYSNITQTYFLSKLSSNPCPYSRYKSGGSAFSNWTQPLSESSFDSKGMQQINMSTWGIELQSAGSSKTSNVYPFPTPTDDTGQGPNIKTAPSNKPGMHFSLINPYAKSTIGTYKGNVIITDSDGRVFTNVDNTQTSDAENPKGVNWRELVSVEMKSLKSISKPNNNDSGMSSADALGKVIQVLRDAKIITDHDEPFSAVKYPDPLLPVPVGGTENYELRVTPFYGESKLYMRSSDTSIVTVPDSLSIESITTESVDDQMVMFGMMYIEITSVGGEGAVDIEFSADNTFNTLLATMPIVVQ